MRLLDRNRWGALLALSLLVVCLQKASRADDIYLPQPAALAMTSGWVNRTPEEQQKDEVSRYFWENIGLGLIGGYFTPWAPIPLLIYDGYELTNRQAQLNMYYACQDPNINMVDFSCPWYANGAPVSATPIYFNDYVLLRELHSPDVYVMIGHAPLYVQSGAYFGWDWSKVHVVTDGRIQKMWKTPVSGTIVKEFSRPEVYLITSEWVGRVKRHIMTEAALYRVNSAGWWAMRTVPDGSLSGIRQASDLW